MEKHPILFTGAGPGAPDLITVRGARAMERADYILYTGSLVPAAVLEWARSGSALESSAGLHLTETVQRMAGAWNQGLRVVRLHTGDPSLYGAIREQMDALDKLGIPVAVIPGVTAAFAAAAALKAEYTVPGVTQTLIFTRISGRTPVPETESLLSLARHGSSMAIYLSAGMAGAVARILGETYGPGAPCACVYKASHPEETVILTTVETLPGEMENLSIRRHALILIGPFLGSREARSLLYRREFSHGYRQAT